MLGNRTGIELRIEPEAEAVSVSLTENWVKWRSEANGSTLGFRDLFGRAGLAGAAEAGMSAALLGMRCR